MPPHLSVLLLRRGISTPLGQVPRARVLVLICEQVTVAEAHVGEARGARGGLGGAGMTSRGSG